MSKKPSKKKLRRQLMRGMEEAALRALDVQLNADQHVRISSGLLETGAMAAHSELCSLMEVGGIYSSAQTHATLAVARALTELLDALVIDEDDEDPLVEDEEDDESPCSVDGIHVYQSTACWHGLHARCIATCKFCGAACSCPCDHDPALAFDEDLLDRLAATLEGYTSASRSAARDVLHVLLHLPRRNTPVEEVEQQEEQGDATYDVLS